jgi:hypothetical protein
VVGLVVPDLAASQWRLDRQRRPLAGTKFDATAENEGTVRVTCPGGNAIRCHAPGPEFGRVTLGIPYVELHAPVGSAEAIVRFYREKLHAQATVAEDTRGRYARIGVGPGQVLRFREKGEAAMPFDGHHIQITLADFSGPYERLRSAGLVTREDNEHQYRFERIIDLASGAVLFTIEHEVRSMLHPMFARPLVNRNPAQTARDYATGHDALAWTLPPGA